MKQLRIYSTIQQECHLDANTQALDSRPSRRVSLDASIQYSDTRGLSGSLLFTKLGNLDPWVLATYIIQNSESLAPLVATQPLSAHPFTVARTISSLWRLYGRSPELNIITGANPTERASVGDRETAHDDRYGRAEEFASILRGLLEGDCMTLEGRFFQVSNLTLQPPFPASSEIRFFVAGSSPAAFRLAESKGDVWITPPEPWPRYETNVLSRWGTISETTSLGLSVGIVARPTHDEAWAVARRLFPKTRRGAIMTRIKQRSDSQWIRRLAELSGDHLVFDDVFWLGAFACGASNAIQVVGSYDDIIAGLRKYFSAGVDHIILSGPEYESELEHLDTVLSRLR